MLKFLVIAWRTKNKHLMFNFDKLHSSSMEYLMDKKTCRIVFLFEFNKIILHINDTTGKFNLEYRNLGSRNLYLLDFASDILYLNVNGEDITKEWLGFDD